MMKSQFWEINASQNCSFIHEECSFETRAKNCSLEVENFQLVIRNGWKNWDFWKKFFTSNVPLDIQNAVIKTIPKNVCQKIVIFPLNVWKRWIFSWKNNVPLVVKGTVLKTAMETVHQTDADFSITRQKGWKELNFQRIFFAWNLPLDTWSAVLDPWQFFFCQKQKLFSAQCPKMLWKSKILNIKIASRIVLLDT